MTSFAARQLERDSQWYEHLADILFGVKTGVVKAKLDERKGSKSEWINQVGKDEDLESKSLGCSTIEDPAKSDYYDRLDRSKRAEGFVRRYQFASGKKICILPKGIPIICPSSDYCFESTWVGVHGMQSICTVTCRDMGKTRLSPFIQRDCFKQQNMRMFTKATIAEVECIPHKDVDHYDDAFRRWSTGSAEKPFSVVSLAQSALEEFGYPHEDEKPVRKAIDYLQSASSDLFHTHYGIIRVAITAYQIICNRKLRGDDIWVTIMNIKPNRFDHLPMDIIAEQLDMINGLSSEKVPRKHLFEYRGPV